MKLDKQIVYADDNTETVFELLKIRVPVLLIGLVLGAMITLITSRFEEVLQHDLRIAFFLPFIVYIADALGTQTQTIYASDLKTGNAKFHNYLIKESLIGLFVGLGFGTISGFASWFWMGSMQLGLAIGLSMFGALLVAPIMALLITQISQLLREDPSVEAGPITTVFQDMASVVIYGLICSLILL